MLGALFEATCAACPHSRGAHDHYRDGLECGLCGCPAYRGRPAALVVSALRRVSWWITDRRGR